MKLYDSLGPNPRVVRMFMREKGIELPSEQVDILGGANRRPPYTDRNPSGQMPSLELDDGSVLAETAAICEYLEEKHPEPPLVGRTPEERAETRMWTRRVEFNITEHLYNGFRFGEDVHSQTAPHGGRQAPYAFDRSVFSDYPAAARRESAGRRAAIWRDGSLGTAWLWRRVHPA